MPETNTISCNVNDLAKASACYCIPDPNVQAGAMIYLLNVISGLNLTPNQIVENSKCYCFSDRRVQQGAITYLLCAIAQSETQ